MSRRRPWLAPAMIALAVGVPLLASTEEAKPLAPAPPQSPACVPDAKNADGTPADDACPPESAAPPVNTLEDIYGAGSIAALLAQPPSVPAAPDSRDASDAPKRPVATAPSPPRPR